MSPAQRPTKASGDPSTEAGQGNIAHLHLMLSLSPSVIYSCGPGPTYATTFISHNVADQLGYDPEAFYADPYFWTKLLHPEDVEGVLDKLARIGSRRRLSYEYRARHREGHYIWLHDQVSAVKDDSGRVSLLVGSWFDISERRRAEEELQEKTRLVEFGAEVRTAVGQRGALAEILRSCAEAMVRHLGAAFARIWAHNEADGVLELQASAGIYTHLGGFHGRIPLGELKIGRIAQERKSHMTNSVVGDPSINDQEWAKREGMVAFAGYPLVEDERLVGVMAMFARKPMGEATLQAMSSVADVIALGIERKRAEEAIRRSERLASIGTLAAGIAHEINNPVTAILLAAQDALSSHDRLDRRGRVDDCLRLIIDQASRCERIIKSVLQFSRQRSTERWPSDLNEIVERAIELTGKYIEQRGAAVRTELRAPLPKVKLNPGQIEQVLVNLIQNAVESGEGVRVVVSTRSATGRVRVAVQDDGRGMTEEQKSHLFDPFFTTREREGGTGLGLSIAHGIVTSLGGTIDVDSVPGRGTMILVELPVAR
jgi:hypothetical protein